MGERGREQPGSGLQPRADVHAPAQPLPERRRDLVTGQRLGRFEILGELGTGGMGVVYAARDPVRERVVALKTLRRLDAAGPGPSPADLYAFKREFRALADLAHPNLVQLYELFSEHGRWFFTMEAIEGTDPLTFVRTGIVPSRPVTSMYAPDPSDPNLAPVPLITTRQYARLRETMGQVASGLAALHRAGMVHRDIKSQNILVTREGRAVLLDFGLIAEAATIADASDVAIVGTAAYMAPEQAAGLAVGFEADWYSFGVLLFESITGRWPFLGPPIRMLMSKQQQVAPRARDLVPDAPEDLDALCAALLSHDPAQRPPVDAILRVLGNAGASAVPATSDSVELWPFVGRVEELAELQRAYADSVERRPVSMLVGGGSGAGKSALVERFLDDIRAETRAVVLLGRCREREQVPYRAVDGVVDALSHFLKQLDPIEAAMLLPEQAPLLGRLFPVLMRVPVLARMAPPAASAFLDEERSRAFAALRQLLARISSRWPLVLVVEDLQWADADSLALLRDLLDPAHAPPLLFLATVRGEAAGLHPAPAAELTAGLGDLRRLDVGPLSREEAVRLAHLLYKRVTGNHAADRTAQNVADEAGCHPLHIEELVRYLGEAGDDAPLRLDEALWARVCALDPESRRLLDVVVAGGVPLPLETATRAAGLRTYDFSKCIAVLKLANLARTTGDRGTDVIEPYHDRVRDAVLRRLGDRERVGHHRRIADELQATGVADRDPHLLVLHLEAAGDHERAAELAERAAVRASAALAFDQAAALYRAVLRLARHAEPERIRIELALAEALKLAGRGPEAAEVYLRVAAVTDPATRLECQRLAARQLLVAGRVDHGVEVLRAVLRDTGIELPESPRRALASLVWRRARLWLRGLRGLRWRRRDESELAPKDLRTLDVYSTVATGMAMVDTIRGADCQARALLLALELGEPLRVVQALAVESMMLSSQGRRGRKRAARLVAEVARVAEEGGHPWLGAYAAAARGFEHFFAGRFRLAAERLREVERMIDEFGFHGFELDQIRLFRLLSLRALGQLREVRAGIETFRRDARRRGDRFAEATLTFAFNGALADDDPDRARAELDAISWSEAGGSYHVQHWSELRARVELDLYAGEGRPLADYSDRFRALERSKLLRVQPIRCEYAWLRGRLALAVGELGLATRMARSLSRERIGYADAWSRLLGAGIAAQKGDLAGAARELRAAADLAEQYELMLIRAAALRRLGELAASAADAGLLAAADDWMATEGIRDPARFAAMLVPGPFTARG